MKRSTIFLWTALVLLFALSAFAQEKPHFMKSGAGMIYGGNDEAGKATRDTVVLIGPWGSGAPFNGQFEDQYGQPAWNGWTHWDVTQPTVSHWQISDYFAAELGADPQPGNLAAWCGDLSFEACTGQDAEGGYGNNWNDMLEFRQQVGNPALAVAVTFTAYVNIDSEPTYDYTHVKYESENGIQTVASFDDVETNLFVNETFTIDPADYGGPGNDEVRVLVQFESDGAASDGDCRYPSAGGVQIDDINVRLDQGGTPLDYFTDFQSGWGYWTIVLPDGVGDFTQIWENLEDIDPCGANYSPQAAFIDDGQIVPGVGPSYCIDWCYGPGGYIVNTTGGLAGPDYHLLNALESPVIPWPAGLDGAWLRFDVYRHEDLSADSPGMFYAFGVRSTTSANPADIALESWQDRAGVYYGGPDYFRDSFPVSDLIEAGRTYGQVQLLCWELGYAWDWVGNDGYPAPYFDNVRFIAYDRTGPGMSTNELRLAQDNFPTIGEVLFNDLGLLSVRFDAAQNIALATDAANVPGDTITVDIVPLRDGAEFQTDPEMHWVMQPNHLFDQWRTSVYGTAVSGVSVGVPAVGSSGQPSPDTWAFDLPDENFFFPGDIIHYYIVATDVVDDLDPETSYLPANRDGYGDFSRPLAYSSTFTVRALPSIYEDPFNPGTLVTPKTLFWNDFANRGGEEEWHGSLANLGFVQGKSYDTYYTQRPDSGVGNGLGGRATVYTLLNYENMLYTCGDMTISTLSNGDYNFDAGDDVGLMDSWLRLGNRGLFMTGDGLVADLLQSGAATTQFVEDWMKVSFISGDVRPLLNNQATPLVQAMAGNPVFLEGLRWVAYGGCPIINSFNAVEADVENGGVRLAEFLDPSGAAGQYGYSAATLFHHENGSDIITMSYDFMDIFSLPDGAKANAPLPVRARILEQVLAHFGVEGDPLDVTTAPGAEKFALRNFPNPFNPATRIEYVVPRPGDLTVKVYNLRGELVRTLVDRFVETSGAVMWDGSDNHGSQVGSGVYFVEARTAGQVAVQKAVLVK